ncbi:hypothetical protein CEXT_152251, partial [Caerostris extrusa]
FTAQGATSAHLWCQPCSQLAFPRSGPGSVIRAPHHPRPDADAQPFLPEDFKSFHLAWNQICDICRNRAVVEALSSNA